MNKTIIRGFKQKDLMIKRIGMDYKKIKVLKENPLMICEEEETYISEKKDLQYYSDLKNKVDYILMQLDSAVSKIIYNEYLCNRKENWWVYYYSKSTYYRLKNKAMNSFLEWWYA